MKKCTKCGKILDESKFSFIKKGENKLRSWCKDCNNEYARKYTLSKKTEQSEKNISLNITNNKVDNLFDVINMKDIPYSVKRGIKIPNKLKAKTFTRKDPFNIRSNLVNVMRRSKGEVHIAQIKVAYYRMFKEVLDTKKLSYHMMFLTHTNDSIIRKSKGYYEFKKGL